ncbi:MAG: type I restriction enzyme HsdR N-terminal domain-containing protein [Nitrospirota bacterium]
MEEKEKLIKEKIMEEEHAELMRLREIKMDVWDVLINEKGFNPEDIDIDPKFKFVLSDCEFTASIDFIVNCSSISFMLIKCATSIESWERYAVAFAQVSKDYQIPYAMVTNGYHARIIDVLTGSLVGESIYDILNRQSALNKMKDFKKIPCPLQRLEKGKRIIYAFEGIKCPIIKKP